MPNPSFRSSKGARRAFTGVATAALTGLALMGAAPAQAAIDVPDTATSALVTRVTADDAAWVTVEVRIAAPNIIGFEVHAPAGDDAWSGSGDVVVEELGIRCRFVGKHSLNYQCGENSGSHGEAPYLALGSYRIALPVAHTGVLAAGTVGHTWVNALGSEGEVQRYGYDSFPVVDGSHFRSTAEVRSAPLQADPDTTLSGLATVPVSMNVVPGEQVASLDVTLPDSASWTLVGTNALPQGVWCSERDTTSGLPILHCTGRFGAPMPTGRYQLVSTLRFAGPRVDGRNTHVALTMVGGVAEQVDTCHFRFPVGA